MRRKDSLYAYPRFLSRSGTKQTPRVDTTISNATKCSSKCWSVYPRASNKDSESWRQPGREQTYCPQLMIGGTIWRAIEEIIGMAK